MRRNAASVFLRENKDLLGNDARNALERAALLYEREAELIGSQEWHKRSPAEFSRFLAKAAKLEIEAIRQIEKALVKP